MSETNMQKFDDLDKLIADLEEMARLEELENLRLWHKEQIVPRSYPWYLEMLCRATVKFPAAAGMWASLWRSYFKRGSLAARQELAAYANCTEVLRIKIFLVELLMLVPATRETKLCQLLPVYAPELDPEKSDKIHALRYELRVGSAFFGAGSIPLIQRYGRLAKLVAGA